ncbi:unnamed protein product [Adineta ricciae]|uniref:Ig-like domain-containing protein n=1 Tax=Adineta ricciae TaxID=249248 RepID=A0A815H3Y3_ADIRI|nr:unnamed protein product [Adineta ricciae]CAF1349097.1 unnamed protein product [Adineta ricciae]
MLHLVALCTIFALPVDETTQSLLIGLTGATDLSVTTDLAQQTEEAVTFLATTLEAVANENGTFNQATTSDDAAASAATDAADQATTDAAGEATTNADAAATDSADQATTLESATADTNATAIADVRETTQSLDNNASDSDALIVTTISTLITDGSSIDANGTDEDATAAPGPSTTAGPTKIKVVLDPATLKVQRGQAYELICTVNNADSNTLIYWVQEEPERRYAFIDSKEKQISGTKATLRSRITLDDPSKIGKYTCMAQDGAGNSDSAVLTMEEESRYYPQPEPQPAYPDMRPPVYQNFQYLRIAAPDMAEGDYVEIQCEGALPDDEPRIQWYFNEKLLGDEDPLFARGKTLYIRPISRPYLGNYRCSIPGGNYGDGNSILTFSKQPTYDAQPGYGTPPDYNPQPDYNTPPNYDVQPGYDVHVQPPHPTGPVSVEEGGNQLIQAPAGYDRAYWSRSDGQGLPDGIYQAGNDLQVTNARAEHTGTYYCDLYRNDGTRVQIPYQIQIRPSETHHQPHPQSQHGGLPKILIQPDSIDLKEGQRMIVQYTIVSAEPINIVWHKYTAQGYEPISEGFTTESNRLILNRATPESAGVYRVTVSNSHGEVHRELRVNVESKRQNHHHHHQQQQQQQQEHQQHDQQSQQQYQPQDYVEVTVEPREVSIAPGEKTTITCNVKGAQQYQVTWSQYGNDPALPSYAHQQGNDVIIAPTADTAATQMYLLCQASVPGHSQQYPAYAAVTIRGAKRKRRNIRH